MGWADLNPIVPGTWCFCRRWAPLCRYIHDHSRRGLLLNRLLHAEVGRGEDTSPPPTAGIIVPLRGFCSYSEVGDFV